MTDKILELARTGDTKAIAILIEDFTGAKVNISIRCGTLVLRTHTTDTKICLQIIQVFEDISCQTRSVQILGKHWNRFFSRNPVTGKYGETTTAVYATMLAIFLGIGVLINVCYKPPLFKPIPTASKSAYSILLNKTDK